MISMRRPWHESVSDGTPVLYDTAWLKPADPSSCTNRFWPRSTGPDN